MSHFVYVLRLNRPEAFSDPTEAEEATIGEHFAYLQGLAAQSVLEFAGPCLDGAFGITLFVADSADEARAIVAADPAVRGGVMSAELHPFRVSVRGPQHT
jgi:uncharacterized protein